MYYSKGAYDEDPAVKAYIDFVVDPANKDFVAATGYVPRSDEQYAETKAKIEAGEVKESAE